MCRLPLYLWRVAFWNFGWLCLFCGLVGKGSSRGNYCKRPRYVSPLMFLGAYVILIMVRKVYVTVMNRPFSRDPLLLSSGAYVLPG